MRVTITYDKGKLTITITKKKSADPESSGFSVKTIR